MVNTHNRHQPAQQIDPYGKLFHLGIQIGKDLTERIVCCLEDYGVSAQCERFVQWTLHHPFASLCALLLAFACGTPIILFTVFAVVSVFVTFVGFLLIEGTILSVATLFLLGIFVTLASVLMTCGTMGLCVYLAYSYVVRNI